MRKLIRIDFNRKLKRNPISDHFRYINYIFFNNMMAVIYTIRKLTPIAGYLAADSVFSLIPLHFYKSKMFSGIFLRRHFDVDTLGTLFWRSIIPFLFRD